MQLRWSPQKAIYSMPPGQKDVQRRENDYQRLIQEIAPLLEKTDRSVLQAVAQEFTACTLSGRLSVKEMLEQLERTAVLSPNAVKVLQTVCEIVDCREGNQLVSEYLKKYPPYSGRRTHSHSAPAALYPAGGSRSGGAPAVMRGVTPAGARRARLVDFLSSRLGPRFVELGEQMERVSRAELADISSDTSADMVSQARRLLGLFLSRHQSCDGDAEILLVRRLRRIRFNRLADELEIWSADQDRWEDPRDWSEDKRRWRSSESHQHRSPVRIPRAACC
ncbi:hypothetical protein FJT64_026747 [Amphibalanus amphitrite]|uniref:Uncharacterized protein n=1 Tax=Amphibalanus amphitrite TaxID=1232801 RepID=A0A6A4W0T3_AMPAM|nr:hypothetical protein FJT64_026747 [Amphibalanus amphitrite]